jgi:ABC-2 type transport system permease protein
MMGAVRSEMRKLFTTRLWWGMGLACVAVSGLFAFLFGIAVSGGPPEGVAGDDVQLVNTVYTGGVTVAAVLIMVLGILSIGQEYRHATITGTFLATPRRTRAMWAKVITLSWIGVLYGVLCLAVSVGIGALALRSSDIDPFPDPEVFRSLALALLVLVLWALIGLGAGILFRNQVAAIMVMVGLTFVGEPLLGLVLGRWEFTRENVAPYLPQAATNAAVNGADAPTVVQLAWWQGALVLAGYAAVLTGIGMMLTERRDVT